MANLVQLKRSSVANKIPGAANVAVGEPVVNLTDKVLYTKNGSNAIIVIGAGTTSNIAEGVNLYYTNARVETFIINAGYQTAANILANVSVAGTDLSGNTTSDLAEGTNLYYTNTRVEAFIVGAGYQTAENILANVSVSSIDLSGNTTSDLAEGTNLYYTIARANTAIDNRVTKTFVDNLNVDADTLDGYNSSDFPRKSENATVTGDWTFEETIKFNGGTSTSLTTGAAWFNSGAGAVLFDDGAQKRISWNDGGGNFNIRTGNYYDSVTGHTYALGTGDVSSGATHILLSSDFGAAGAIGLYVAPVGTPGTAVSFTNSLIIDTTTSSAGAGGLKYNNVQVWHANNDGSGSGLDADTLDGIESTAFALTSDLTTANVTEVTNLYYTVARANTAIDNRVTKTFVDALAVDAGSVDGIDGSAIVTTTTITNYTINPRFSTTIGFGNDTEILYFNDGTNQTRSGYWASKDGFEIRGDNNSKDAVVLQTGHLDLTQNAYINGILGIGSSFSSIPSSPTSKLFVGGDLTLNNGTRAILGNLYYTTNWKYVGNGYGWGFRLDNSSGVLQFLRASNNTSGADANASVSLNSTISVDLANDRVGVGTATPGYKLEVNGSFAATTKSFVIPHPTKKGKKLRYGSLEGPENGVYVRGSTTSKIIKLPSYWTKLIDPESITVNLTPKGEYQQLFVEKIENNKVYIKNSSGKNIDCFYTIFAERIDVEKLEVEV